MTTSNYYADIIYSTVATAGQQATFAVDTANAGTEATGTRLEDQLPAGLSWTRTTQAPARSRPGR